MPYAGVHALGDGEAQTLREIDNEPCDLCGDTCYPNDEICVAISCCVCEVGMYHKGCVEKFLKKYKYASNRMCGFVCPRGRGKGTKAAKECSGKTQKSHPIVPKNEKKKEARAATVVLEAMAVGGRQPGGRPAPAPKPPKPAGPKMAVTRKMAHPKPHSVQQSVARTYGTPGAGSSGSAWGAARGAAPVLANAHVPAVDEGSAAEGGGDNNSPRPAGMLPVGLVLEEAMSKAGKKNAARKKRRAAAAAVESGSAASEAGSELTSDQGSVLDSLASGAAGAGSSSGASAALLLEAQGHRFVNDLDAYNRLLAQFADNLYSEDEDGEGGAHDVSVCVTPAEAAAMVAACSPATPVLMPVAVPIAVPLAVPVLFAAAEPPRQQQQLAKESSVEDAAAIEAAIQASMAQYELEQDMARQREVLAGGGFIRNLSPAGGTAPPPATTAAAYTKPPYAPLPGVAGKAQPPEPAAAAGWVFGAGGDAQYLAPTVTSASHHGSGGYPVMAAGGGYPAMAAGHTAPEAAAGDDDDDDDLGALLALCGVAG